MAQGWSAAKVAHFDQSLASADRELDGLVQALHAQTDEVGEHRPMANVAALVSLGGTDEVLGLLMAALRRIGNAQ